jgi:hypothetical protein
MKRDLTLNRKKCNYNFSSETRERAVCLRQNQTEISGFREGIAI